MSMVRLNCCTYTIKDNQKEKASEIWPILKDENYPICKEMIIDIDDIPDWVGEIEAITMKPIRKIKFITNDEIPNLNKIDQKAAVEFVKNVSQVVMPGYELLKYKSLKVVENACTDEINKYLDEGWSMIAVMPQHQQRRPDYILVNEKEGV